MRPYFLKIGMLLFVGNLQAQTDSLNPWKEKPTLEYFGFVDGFYGYDFGKNPPLRRQVFLYNHNRHNSFNINLALLQFKLSNNKCRMNLGGHLGTYVIDNYQDVQSPLRYFSEANFGISLNNKNSWWLDGGIMPSHLGFESAMSIENLTLSRSLCAENLPYFLTGAKLSYQPSDRFAFRTFLVNGWQRLHSIPGNSIPAFGTQVNWQNLRNVEINWSTFVGSEYPDDVRRMRFFNNLYAKYKFGEKYKLIIGADLGFEQRKKADEVYYSWVSPVIIQQFRLGEKWNLGLRAEGFVDEHGVVLPKQKVDGYSLLGTSLNFDYTPNDAIKLRFESRRFWANNDIFESETLLNTNLFMMFSLAVRLGGKVNLK